MTHLDGGHKRCRDASDEHPRRHSFRSFLKRFMNVLRCVDGARLPQRVVSDLPFENTYDLTVEQIRQLDEAEDLMLKHDLSAAERLLLSMLELAPECIPVLNNLAHLYGRHLSEFESAVETYDRVLALEPDNAWARDARRRYLRYIGRL